MITKPFCRTAGMKRPTTVPAIVPMPPKRLVPPMTTPAMTFRAVLDWPAIVVDAKKARLRIPASPAQKPASV